MGKKSRKTAKFAVILTICVLFCGNTFVRAEEYPSRRSWNADSYPDASGYEDVNESPWDENYIEIYDEADGEAGGYDDFESYDEYRDYEDYSDEFTVEQPEEPADPGTYSVASGWSLDEAQSSDDTEVYRQDAFSDAETTSLITCSYLDTNYSVSEYEQLRDMLISNLLYDNVNAQISTSAVYTQAMDYLFIIVVDDPDESFLDIYHYVVGDYICFCVQVKEIRSQAEEDEAAEVPTPQQAGLSMAESFTWN